MLPNIKGVLQSNSSGGAPFTQGQEGIFQDITSAYVSHIAQADYGYSGMTRVDLMPLLEAIFTMTTMYYNHQQLLV